MTNSSTQKSKTLLLVQYAILTALVIVLQLLSNVLSFGAVQFSLSLIPLVIGAFLVGPFCSAYLGFVLGIVNLISSFQNPVLTYLFNSSPVLYVLTCVGKTVLAGLAAGWIYRALREKAVLLASAAAPIVNTGTFFVMMAAFFQKAIAESCGLDPSANVIVFVITAFITFNFFIELGLNVILAPAFKAILKAVRSQRKHSA